MRCLTQRGQEQDPCMLVQDFIASTSWHGVPALFIYLVTRHCIAALFWTSVQRCNAHLGYKWVDILQVAWICDLLGPPKGVPRRLALYLGLVPAGAGPNLEVLLRFKCLVLIAVILKWRSLRWA